MRLLIQSDSETVDLFKELQLLTNTAKVTLADIVVDESRNEITIPMERKSYERKRLLLGESYKLVSSELINSRLIIKNVAHCKMEDNLHLSNIQLLFGVRIKNKEIYLSSVEEQSGVSAFEMPIEVRSYDIELRDD